MRIGFVGCGDAADQYFQGLAKYPELEMAAATDLDQRRAAEFGNYHSVNTCSSLEPLLFDASIEIIVNLTNARSHFEVSRKCLAAGKHVYSEKPLALTLSEAQSLVALARAKGLYLGGAPCSLLGATACTVWKALRNNDIGTVRVVYAEMDDGPLHLQGPDRWRSVSGAPFNYREVFEVGPTLEHAEYYLSWFAAFFGPAKTVTAYSACLCPHRQVVPGEPLDVTTPDFSVACITFESGVVARLTCSLLAPHNHGMQIVGDTGVLTVDECWNVSAPVYLDRYSHLLFRVARYPITRRYPFILDWIGLRRRTYPPVGRTRWRKRQARYHMDYAAGIADMARAIRERRPPRLGADFCLHVTELVLAIQNPAQAPYRVTTTFAPLEPIDEDALAEGRSIGR
jgi:predicted dehydrogenase